MYDGEAVVVGIGKWRTNVSPGLAVTVVRMVVVSVRAHIVGVGVEEGAAIGNVMQELREVYINVEDLLSIRQFQCLMWKQFRCTRVCFH